MTASDRPARMQRPGLIGFLLLVLANVLMLVGQPWATAAGYAAGIAGLLFIAVAVKRRIDRQVKLAPSE